MLRRTRSHANTGLILGSLLMVTACDGTSTPAEPEVSVVVSPEAGSLMVGESMTLTATVTGTSNTLVDWSSSGPAVAVVSPSGRVQGMAPGTVAITATSRANPRASDSMTLDVLAPHGSCQTLSGRFSVGESVSGALTRTDCLPVANGSYVDVWELTVHSPTSVVVSMSAGFDAFLGLFRSDGATIFDDDSGPGLDSEITSHLPAGTHLVTATSVVPGATGSYSLAAARSGGGQALTIRVRNLLIDDVAIAVNGDTEGSVPGGETRETRVLRTSDVDVSWSLIRRTTSSGVAVGERMGGRWATLRDPPSLIEFTVDAVVDDQRYFAPVIENQSGVSLLMGVNMGLHAESRCNCVISPGSTGTPFGYYRLYSNSNVRAYRSGSDYMGSYIYWRQFAQGVDPQTGVLHLRATRSPAMMQLVPGAASNATVPGLVDPHSVEPRAASGARPERAPNDTFQLPDTLLEKVGRPGPLQEVLSHAIDWEAGYSFAR